MSQNTNDNANNPNEDAVPRSCFVESQGLRLHYADWGNADAPLVVLVHGGRDHGRSWDAIARALRPRFHVIAPDLRGHGDSDWARGSSYTLADNIYDLTRLLAGRRAVLVGHSFGGMIAMACAGAFPAQVSRLVVIDGAFLPGEPKPIDTQIADWVAQLDRTGAARPRRFANVGEAAARMTAHNARLTPELALHLATHAVRRNDDGSLSWKYDPYGMVRAPYRLSAQDYVALWSRIACPTLHITGGESFIPDIAAAGILRHFRHAEHRRIAGAAHWVQHDRPAETLALIARFLAADAEEGGQPG